MLKALPTIGHSYSEYIEIEGNDEYHKSTCDICHYNNDKIPHGEPNAENKCPDCGHTLKPAVELKQITIDFTKSNPGIEGNATTSNKELTIDPIKYVYNNTQYYSDGYLMMKSSQSFFANSTAIPGAIVKVTINIRSGASTSAVYYISIGDSSMLSVNASGTSKTGSITSLSATANQSNNYSYFNITQKSSKNGQITKIVIDYYG